MAAYGMMLGRSIIRSTSALFKYNEVNRLLTRTVTRPLLESCYCPTTIIITRDASFFNRLSADQIWDSVKGVSNQGKMKGRAKGKRKKFSVVKKFGEGGKYKMFYPAIGGKGLETSISSQKVVGEEIEDKASKHSKHKPKRDKLWPLQRGYTGRRVVGKRFEPPKPKGQFTFEGFEAVCVDLSMVANMTGTLGRKRSFTSLVVVGNGKGLAGYASASSISQFRCIDKAREGAAKHLHHIDLYDGHTVYHNNKATVGSTTVIINKQEKGYGLRCHRIIKSICELFGIKDLHVKVEGRCNEANIAKAFFKALLEQETHQELADRMKMHVVEFRREKGYFPQVVASPQDGVIHDPPRDKENYDFENFYFKGKTQFFPKRPAAFYKGTPSWHKKTRELYKMRNQKEAQMARRIQGFEHSGVARQKE